MMQRLKIFFLCLIASFTIVHAQDQPVLRIGILDDEQGPTTSGARLAAQELNDSGGVRGADGSFLRLELVVQPPDMLLMSASLTPPRLTCSAPPEAEPLA
jgi:hypothetical protein